MSKETAVDVLVKELTKLGYLHDDKHGNHLSIMKIIRDAKELEKEQMKNTLLDNVTKHEKFRRVFEKQFEEYYNDNFLKNKLI